MSIKFTKISKILVITTIASLFSVQAAQAEKMEEPVSLNEAFHQAYFKHGKNAFKQSGILGQLNTMIGYTEFPERHIVKDGRAVDKLYRDALRQQTAVGMPIMTQDLVNPYSTSLLENMDYVGY